MTLIEALKPYLWLAAIAFAVGFVSYVALGPATPAVAQQGARPVQPVAVPVTDDWNVPKQI